MQLMRNSLVYVWFFLTAITVVSWWISHSSGTTFHIDQAITMSVLLIAAIKSHFVIRHFMEVRHAPVWLKRTTEIWLAFLFSVLTVTYLININT